MEQRKKRKNYYRYVESRIFDLVYMWGTRQAKLSKPRRKKYIVFIWFDFFVDSKILFKNKGFTYLDITNYTSVTLIFVVDNIFYLCVSGSMARYPACRTKVVIRRKCHFPTYNTPNSMWLITHSSTNVLLFNTDLRISGRLQRWQ